MKCVALPPAQFKRLRRVRNILEHGDRSHGIFGGKRLSSNKSMVSIPLGRHWRAIFEIVSNNYKYRDTMSHEKYNKYNFRAR